MADFLSPANKVDPAFRLARTRPQVEWSKKSRGRASAVVANDTTVSSPRRVDSCRADENSARSHGWKENRQEEGADIAGQRADTCAMENGGAGWAAKKKFHDRQRLGPAQ